jgi:hypothetical protein
MSMVIRRRKKGTTHLSRVDLLTAERIVVGTHLERRRCAAGRDELLSVGVGWLSRSGLCGELFARPDTIVVRCGASLKPTT